MRIRVLFLLMASSLVSWSVLGAQTAPAFVTKDDYARLLGWRFAAGSSPVPPEGLTFTKDTASWSLQSGTFRLMEPASDGSVTGLVFEGQGRFVMGIPDRFEVAQLRRFSDTPTIGKIDTAFTRLVLRTSSGMLAPYANAKAGGGFERNDCAKDRHEAWLRIGDLDADARVIAGLLTPGDDYLVVDVETKDFGWLMYEYEPLRQEEITLTKLQKENYFPEIWVSLDRPEERDRSGRPTSADRQQIDVTNVDVEVTITDASDRALDWVLFNTWAGSDWAASAAGPERAWVHFKSRLSFLPLVDGARALPLYLDPSARVTSVADGNGAELPFLRDATGKRFASMDNELNNGALTVLLGEPTRKGVGCELVFDYDMKIFNYATGRYWYPGEAGTAALSDVHTGRMTFTMPKKYQVRAVGTPEDGQTAADGLPAVWNVTKPVKMMGFSFGKNFKDEKIKTGDLPEIDSFGSETGVTTGNMVRNVAADIVNALNFYGRYFDVKLPAERIYAARIMAFHGQAFEGFLHLSFLTYDSEHPGYSELFRAHEAAHQYWGHLVGWKSYRDQWLSEAFAEYSALLFLEAAAKGKGPFEKLISDYADGLTGQSTSLSYAMRRSAGQVPTAKQRRRVGPIAAGFRASTAEVPDGYTTVIYDKGALVLHMIRMICWAAVRDRDAFRETLQDFLKTYAGRTASTVDFLRILQKHTGIDWIPFFENWIFGTAIPSYTWSYEVAGSRDAEGRYPCTLKVAQADVPEGFSADVPVRFDFGGDKWTIMWLSVDAPERTFELPLQAKPVKVTFNPRNSVLAKVEKGKK